LPAPFGSATTNVNPYTGEISINQISQGAFLNVYKVTSYRCGIKVSEIFRETQTVFSPTGTNNPPNVTAPFKDSQGQYTLYTDTVLAGDLVCFNVSATDFDFLPNGTPQTLFLETSGGQFGDIITSTTPPSMSATSGCLNPPCATLMPTPAPPTYPLSGQIGLQTQFCWQTSCSHVTTNIGCGNTSNEYNFPIKVYDDYCPIPAVNMATITIVVLGGPIFDAPEIHCVEVHQNGDVTLKWTLPLDTIGAINMYYIDTASNWIDTN